MEKVIKETKMLLVLVMAFIISFAGCTTYDEIVQVLKSDKCPGLCCNSINFNGITEKELNNWIREYRNQDWGWTSPLVKAMHDNGTINLNNGLDASEFSMVLNKITTNNLQDDSTALDARCLEIDIDQLENYICLMHKSTIRPQVEKLRLYYIRYPSNFNEPKGYSNKHSLAFVPVLKNNKELTNPVVVNLLGGNSKDIVEKFNPIFAPNFGQNQQRNILSTVENHNQLHPPPPNHPSITDIDSRLFKVDNSYQME